MTKEVARLSPLLFEHINVLGRDHFELVPSLAQGALPAFSDPTWQPESDPLEA